MPAFIICYGSTTFTDEGLQHGFASPVPFCGASSQVFGMHLRKYLCKTYRSKTEANQGELHALNVLSP